MTPASSPTAVARWTGWQITVAVAAGIVAVAVSPLFFASLFMTVRDLLASSFGPWPWIVPIATEGSFVVLYLLDILLTLRRKPMGWLHWAPYVFAAGSLALNILAGHGHLPATLGHAMVTLAFFIPVIAAESAVRALSASEDEVQRAQALADARRYAMDLLRDRKGIAWRWRPSVPSLLRRQVLTGRLPAAVVTAVRDSLREYGDPWEPDVRDWILGRDGLNLTAQADVASQRAAETIRQEAAVVVSETPREDERTQPDPPRVPRERPQQKASAQPGRDLTPEALAALARKELPLVPVPSINALMALAEEHAGTIGRPKAKKAQDILNAGRVQLAPSRAAGS